MFPVLIQESVMSALRKQMEADMVIRGLAYRTREAYVGSVAKLAKHYGRPPDQISEAEVQRYLLYLSFGAPRIVAQTRGYSDAPKLAVDRNGTVHLVYAESSGGPFDRYHVRYARSRDRARTFEPARDISKPLPQGIQSAAFPALSLDEQANVYVLWELFPESRAHPRGLAIAYSRDRGEMFERPSVVPGSSDSAGASNGSHQGLLMRKLAVNGAGSIAVVNSSLKEGEKSRVWLTRGQARARS
jgi:Phage integrase, N-terminal SAM-like domain